MALGTPGIMLGMAERALDWFYRRLGSNYPAVYLFLEFFTAFFVTVGAVALLTFYFDMSDGEFLRILALAVATTFAGVTLNMIRLIPRVEPIQAWLGGKRSPEQTQKAWERTISLPLDLIRQDVWIPLTFVVVPVSIFATYEIGASWPTVLALLAFGVVATAYSATLHYLAIEAGFRPILLDINRHLPPRLQTECRSIPLRWRLFASLPLINIITGLVVAAFTSEGGGAASLGADVLIAVGVATTISLELTLLLSKSILFPIADLQRATAKVAEGDYTATVPVTTADEIGELAASFNTMVEGLAEREKIREAFGTYLDREVAEFILSGNFPEEGVEVEVSVLFTDVKGFTTFASQASAREVVARLNKLFEAVVPIIARHGGHVDKFEGDGVLAVFGAPEGYRDHAERAVRAALEMAQRINVEGAAGDWRIGVGVNSGNVVAGSIGGAGRLNFSVIGDPVNVAARIEAMTRDLDVDVLISQETMKRLGHDFEVESCGHVELKGIDGAPTLYEPSLRAEASVDSPPVATPSGDTAPGAGVPTAPPPASSPRPATTRRTST
jgi:adenylate cyclase